MQNKWDTATVKKNPVTQQLFFNFSKLKISQILIVSLIIATIIAISILEEVNGSNPTEINSSYEKMSGPNSECFPFGCKHNFDSNEDENSDLNKSNTQQTQTLIQQWVSGYKKGLPSPYSQVFNQIWPQDVICNNDLTLLIKTLNGAPICVSSSSVIKYIERGFAIKPSPL